MTKQTEALKLALEALDNLMYWDNGKPEYDEARQAITALREALTSVPDWASEAIEQPAQQEPLDDHAEKEDVESLKRQLSLQTSMCIAYKKENEQLLAANKDCINHFDALKADYDALRAQQEPEYWLWACGQHIQVSLKKPEFPDAIPLYTRPQAREPLTDEQIDLFINGRGDEGDDDYVEPTGDGFGLTDADLVRLVRRVEAAHGIKENT